MEYKYYIGRALVKILRLNKKLSHSLVNEDNIIDWLTGYKKKGVYMDIGANHPDNINNTKLFYERGWRGINIEPDKRGYELFCQKRPSDINLNCAIGDGEIDYFGDENDSTGNTFVKELAESRGGKKIRKLKLKPLSEVFAENNLDIVEFMSIDVEKFENEVLKSNNWYKYKAKIICIEGFKYNYLKQFGYKMVFWDGINSYYKLTNKK